MGNINVLSSLAIHQGKYLACLMVDGASRKNIIIESPLHISNPSNEIQVPNGVDP
jgi:hypothetical protein